MRESSWTQFDGDGDPLISQNKNKSGQVTSADIGIMQINDNNDGQTVTLPDGTHVVIDQQRLANDWQYNMQIGSAILNSDLIAARSYLQKLGRQQSEQLGSSHGRLLHVQPWFQRASWF
jgi:hypothetical protein